jgi:hypothetical protein
MAATLRAEYSRFFADASGFALLDEPDTRFDAPGPKPGPLGEDSGRVDTHLFGARAVTFAERAAIHEDLAREVGIDSPHDLEALEHFGERLLGR